MPRKPPDWHQPSLFPTDPDQSPEPQNQSHPNPEGEQHAVQDYRPRTPATETTDTRPAPEGPEAAAGSGDVRAGAEDQARSLEGNAGPGEAGQRPEPDRVRGAGNGAPGLGGAFALRITSERQRNAFPRRGNGVHPQTHVARLKASRKQPTLFDSVSGNSPPATPAPPGATSNDTVISPPVIASGNGDPTPLPACNDAPAHDGPAREAQFPARADSSSCRKAPRAGPETPGEGNQAMMGAQLSLQFDTPPPFISVREQEPTRPAKPAPIASGEKSKARDIIAAIHAVKKIEQEHRPATQDEKQALARFAGFGPVALSLFPDPVTGKYKDAGWQSLGDELKTLLTPQEYDSARRTTFNAFYTSPTVIASMHEALTRLGVADNATILEPGCGIGNFMSQGTPGNRFIGVEMDSISGRIAKAIHPQHDIRIENFRDSKLPENRIDAVIGNVPFADLKIEYQGHKLSLHDFFFAKSIDALKPGGVLALVTSHFTLDKQNAAIREYLAAKADFVGAIRLPSDAFKREGTAVVTDIVFLRKRAPGEPANHVDSDWLSVAPLLIDGAEVPVNRYFLNHPEMVLGTWTRKDTLYGGEGYSVLGNGDLAGQLTAAIHRLPEFATAQASPVRNDPAPAFIPPPPERHIGEGSFFIGDDRIIYQSEGGQGVPVVYGGTSLKADGTLTGKRLAALLGLRDRARRVLQSQNEGWPDSSRDDARRELNLVYDRFVAAYGPINKTTFGETADGSMIRRMPN